MKGIMQCNLVLPLPFCCILSFFMRFVHHKTELQMETCRDWCWFAEAELWNEACYVTNKSCKYLYGIIQTNTYMNVSVTLLFWTTIKLLNYFFLASGSEYWYYSVVGCWWWRLFARWNRQRWYFWPCQVEISGSDSPSWCWSRWTMCWIWST